MTTTCVSSEYHKQHNKPRQPIPTREIDFQSLLMADGSSSTDGSLPEALSEVDKDDDFKLNATVIGIPTLNAAQMTP